MTIKLNIQPYVGVGDIRFGLTQSEIEKLLGPADSQNKGFRGDFKQYRRDNGLITTYDRSTNKLVEIGFSQNITELEFENEKIFSVPPLDILCKLIKLDGAPYERLGFIVLLKLGVTLTGFHDGATEQKAVTVFVHGRWDDQIAKMKPFYLT